MDAATKKAAEDRLREMMRQDLKAHRVAQPFSITRRKGSRAQAAAFAAPTPGTNGDRLDGTLPAPFGSTPQ